MKRRLIYYSAAGTILIFAVITVNQNWVTLKRLDIGSGRIEIRKAFFCVHYDQRVFDTEFSDEKARLLGNDTRTDWRVISNEPIMFRTHHRASLYMLIADWEDKLMIAFHQSEFSDDLKRKIFSKFLSLSYSDNPLSAKKYMLQLISASTIDGRNSFSLTNAPKWMLE